MVDSAKPGVFYNSGDFSVYFDAGLGVEVVLGGADQPRFLISQSTGEAMSSRENPRWRDDGSAAHVPPAIRERDLPRPVIRQRLFPADDVVTLPSLTAFQRRRRGKKEKDEEERHGCKRHFKQIETTQL